MLYQVGDIVVGEVTGIQSYGAFVRLESGESGLVHISEISSLFVRNIEDYVYVGQEIRVKILEVLKDKGLYRLSYKQALLRRRQNVRKITSRRRLIQDHDFHPLARLLPIWMNEELKKIKEE